MSVRSITAHRRGTLFAVAAWLATTALHASEPTSRSDAIAPASMAQLDTLFADFARKSHVPGLVYGVVADGRLVHVRGLGVQDIVSRRPVTPETLFRIASMTKAFTALTVLKLRDDGKLQLDALAETYVGELRGWSYPTLDAPRIRVRDLLNHSAGLVTDDPWGDRQTPMPEAQFTQLLREGVPLTRTPGLRMEYSNLGYALLGRVIGNVSGEPYVQTITRTLLQPLGMAASGWDVDAAPRAQRALGYSWEDDAWQLESDMAHGAFGAMGGLQTNAVDYAKWVAYLLAAWPARNDADPGPVKRASVRELAQGSNFAQLLPPRAGRAKACHRAVSYGMGMLAVVDCELGTYLSHSGGYPGYGSNVLLLPEYGVGIFAFANRTYAGAGGPVLAAAHALRESGFLKARSLAVSDELAQAYRAVGAIYAKGELAAGGDVLAMNFLLDRSAAGWARELAKLKRELGECDASAPIVADGTLSGRFSWACASGHAKGSVLLAPTRPPRIQAMEIERVAP